MSKNYDIKDSILISYMGVDQNAVIPEGVHAIKRNAFFHLDELKSITLPEGLVSIEDNAFCRCKNLEQVLLPATLESFPSFCFSVCPSMKAVNVADGNSFFKSMDGVLFSADMKKLLYYPIGKGLEYHVPTGVEYVDLNSFNPCYVTREQNMIVHIPPEVQSFIIVGSGWPITVCAPTGSAAEAFARYHRLGFIAEGEPVATDDSHTRAERTLKEWRSIFTISSRKTGLNISVYLRSSKIVYLPDTIGKMQVGTINKTAFPQDTAVLCSKRLFAKLAQENKDATIRAFLFNSSLFSDEEQAYLKDTFKKKRAYYLELFIRNEDQSALTLGLKFLASRKILEECFEITERLNKTHMNFALLALSSELEK